VIVIGPTAVERRTAVVPAVQVASVTSASSQTDQEEADDRELRYRTSLREMLYQFLIHTVQLKRGGNLVDALVTKDVLTPGERLRIREQKRADVKANVLMMILREKSADRFESFLGSLCETGQQLVADVVRQALHTSGQTEHNPLRIFDGKVACSIYTRESDQDKTKTKPKTHTLKRFKKQRHARARQRYEKIGGIMSLKCFRFRLYFRFRFVAQEATKSKQCRLI